MSTDQVDPRRLPRECRARDIGSAISWPLGASQCEWAKANEGRRSRQRLESREVQSSGCELGPEPKAYVKTPTLSANFKLSILWGFRPFFRETNSLRHCEVLLNPGGHSGSEDGASGRE